MADKLTLRRLLGFKDFFPNEIPESKEYYATKLGREFLFRIACHFLSYFRLNAIPSIDTFLEQWFTFYQLKYWQSPSYYFIRGEYDRIKYQNNKQSFDILSVESFLKMFLWLNQKVSISEKSQITDASSTIISLKFLLLFNDDVLANYQVASKSIEHYKGDRELQRKLLAISFPQHDLVNIDFAQIVVAQFYKVMKLLDFISTTPAYKHLYQKFLSEFNFEKKEDYLVQIAHAVILSLQNEKPGWTLLNVPLNKNFEKNCSFLEKLSIEEKNYELIEQNDFIEIRNTPFQKISKGKYRVIFDLFLAKKVYNGLIFKLSEFCNNDKTLLKDFLGTIRDGFLEGVLVYNILDVIFNNINARKITGIEFKAAGLKRESDFYLRSDNKIVLFESKDFFIRGEIKLSYNFDEIEKVLKSDKSGKIDRLGKAVVQLSENIRRVIMKELILDTDYVVSEIIIFPVIIVHDSLYSAPALNYWVHYWLHDLIDELKQDSRIAFFDFGRVMPLTIIEIDTLILYKSNFNKNELNLIGLIEMFHSYVEYEKKVYKNPVEIEEHAFRSALSFSEFVRDYGYKIDIRLDVQELLDLFSQFGIN